MKIIKDINYSNFKETVLDIYLPQTDSFPVFLYFHGGGLCKGDKADFGVEAEYLTANGICVVSANYRMYPGAKYPDFLEDGAKAVAWVTENIKNYGNVKEIYVGGSSAGGYISQMLCFNGELLLKAGVELEKISGFIHDAGQPTSHFNVLGEKGVDSRRVIVDETAPLYYVGIGESYPPMLIIVSDNDMQNRYEQTMLLVSTLKHFGHEAELKIMNGKHCEYIGKKDGENESVFGKIILDFIKKYQCS